MTATINDPVHRIPPVFCSFWWEGNGPPYLFTIEGNTYPYTHQKDNVSRGSDSRYIVTTTQVDVPVTFDATDHESLGHPKVLTPVGVTILEYNWNFGDGFTDVGPVVQHTYVISDPTTRITLDVLDSRGLRWSCTKTLNLTFLNGGKARAVSNKLRV